MIPRTNATTSPSLVAVPCATLLAAATSGTTLSAAPLRASCRATQRRRPLRRTTMPCEEPAAARLRIVHCRSCCGRPVRGCPTAVPSASLVTCPSCCCPSCHGSCCGYSCCGCFDDTWPWKQERCDCALRHADRLPRNIPRHPLSNPPCHSLRISRRRRRRDKGESACSRTGCRRDWTPTMRRRRSRKVPERQAGDAVMSCFLAGGRGPSRETRQEEVPTKKERSATTSLRSARIEGPMAEGQRCTPSHRQ